MIEKVTDWDKIEISNSGVIRVKTSESIVEDGRVIAKNGKNSMTYEPGEPILNEHISKLAKLYHTLEVIEKYIDKKIKALQESGIKGMESEIKRLQAIKAETK
jgi:DUF917 family protein